jgi:hypothetical protein
VPLPDPALAEVVVPAPGAGVGHWAGAPSAVADGDGFWLAYRLRRPVALGRGVAVEVARYEAGRSEVVARVERGAFGAESLERPARVRRPDGGWRLYVSCATPGSKHWWVEALDADAVADLPAGARTVVWPGSATLAVKDPVVRCDADGWHAWVCCHPLDLAGEEDRMWSAYACSDDGLVWSEPVPVLAPGADGWDRRGRRVTAVLRGDRLAAYYDGRADAAQNWYERTGLALAAAGAGPDAVLSPVAPEPVARAAFGTGALRYLCVVPLPDGTTRLFYETSRADGAHDLVTQVVPSAPAG